jgi:hypothetical protein
MIGPLRVVCTSLCAVTIAGFASTAAAQNRPSVEVSGGWQFLHSTEVDRIGVRLGASYVRFGASDGGNAFRVRAGVVIPF